MDVRISRIKTHQLKCDDQKFDSIGSEVFLIQNIVATVAWFESTIKQAISKDILKNYLIKEQKIKSGDKNTYLTLLRKFLAHINSSFINGSIKINFFWEISQFTTLKNKNILLDWTTFYKYYLIVVRNKAVHNFELDNKIQNNELFNWFYNGILDLTKEILSFFNKIILPNGQLNSISKKP